ncbi:uncharacterized protein RCC_06393 [Ramularia collo-cygni]|uniref:Rad60/SUMO-like domain-containing protein n=1 Tax=Ramularia collo-cygni TaxID=112498 RepID=A0A2D3VCQ2_9PEZI|nr:uncharacterized protein RCC_06393 [Ramularia collo-cygni]CZT20534.1 uncharacterized protein RCC_06393 [Ramularia collo-cygni]
MSSRDSSNTISGDAADDARAEPEVLMLDDNERPPATTEKLNLRFEEIGSGKSLDIFYKRDRPMGKPMAHFANYIGRNVKQCRFIFDGVRMDALRSPNERSASQWQEIANIGCSTAGT